MKCIWKQCLAASIALAIGAAGAAEASRPGDKPLVVNGDLSLTTLDFDAYMERVPPQLRDEFRAEASKVNPTVDALWVRRVLAARARAAGMDKDAIMAARMRQSNDDLLAEAYLEDVAKKVKVPNLEARAREIYKVRAKDYAMPEVITAEHILVSTKTYSKEAALARAQEAYQRVTSGEDFHKVAEEFTDNKASIDITSMTMTSFVRPLPEAISKLKVGEIMPPTETQYGFHVLKLKNRIPSRVKTFEEVKDELIAVERQKIVDDEKTAVVEAIRGDPGNHLYVENLQGLKGDFRVPSADELKKQKPNVRQ
ncbi:MAG TPA: peptidyl-prolyl cis-trans isomerase [Usitatibacter sp.]|nr:peptidyl-prolyl cis-trans isomerase [Usitatibacter sp.]